MTCCLEAPGLWWQLESPLSSSTTMPATADLATQLSKFRTIILECAEILIKPRSAADWSSLTLRIFSQFEMPGEHVSPTCSISLLFSSFPFFFWLKSSLDKGLRGCTWRNSLWGKVDKETIFGSYRLTVVLSGSRRFFLEEIGSTNSIMLISFSIKVLVLSFSRPRSLRLFLLNHSLEYHAYSEPLVWGTLLRTLLGLFNI